MINRRNIWYFIQQYKINSLFIRNFVLIFSLIVIPVGGIAVVMYQNTHKIIEQDVTETSINSLYRVKDMVDTIFYDTERLATRISLENDVHIYMLSDDPGIYSNFRKTILEKINTYPLVYRYISSIYIYSDKNRNIISNSGGSELQISDDASWYDAYLKKEDNDPWIQARKHNHVYPYYISIAKPAGLSYTESRIGAVIVNLNTEELGKILHRTENNVTENIFILDREGTILYNKDTEKISTNIREMGLFSSLESIEGDYSGVQFIKDEEYIVVSVKSGYHDGRYVSLIPFKFYQDRLDKIGSFMVAIILICVAASIVFSYIISIKTFRPVQNIMSFVDNPGEWSGGAGKESKFRQGELNYITERIMNIIYSNNDLKTELDKRMGLMRKTQSSALQAQINPHFLYNTLETINWKAIRLTQGKNDVSRMLTLLSSLLRLSMDANGSLILIKEEIEHAKCYIEIIKMRYEDKVNIVWDVDEKILEYKIIKLILQPIIENAVYHGIKPKRLGGTIRIKGALNGANIEMEISDDGVGMDNIEIQALNLGNTEEFDRDAEHIGLKNVDQRIRLIFGNDYGIGIESVKGAGTSVKVNIPAVK